MIMTMVVEYYGDGGIGEEEVEDAENDHDDDKFTNIIIMNCALNNLPSHACAVDALDITMSPSHAVQVWL